MKLIYFTRLLPFVFNLVNAHALNRQFLMVNSDPDEYGNTSTLIRSKGYIAEEHDVITDDGYILTIFRVSPRFHRKPKQVAFLQHGLLDSSSTWVINFQYQSLGFILADAGYDVWLGNMRGNTYGRRHVALNDTQDEFWNFSWDEMAKHDLPSMINYVLRTTNNNELFYVGHSQGTLIGFSQFGKDLELGSKIKLFIALGPVATVNHIKSPLHYLAKLGTESDQQIWFSLFGKKSFLSNSAIHEWISEKTCEFIITDKIICAKLYQLLFGPSVYINETRIPVYKTHDPSGTSVKNLVHFAQMVISGKFQMYDYRTNNMLHYNQTTPPLYNLNQVKIPVALYWSDNDFLADKTDVQFLKENLPFIIDELNLADWNHLGFVWATNTKAYLYDRIIKLMNKFI